MLKTIITADNAATATHATAMMKAIVFAMMLFLIFSMIKYLTLFYTLVPKLP